jgi:hypothetical protein
MGSLALYRNTACAVLLSRLAAAALALAPLGGCGSISIPLGSMFGQPQRAETTTGTIERAPAERVAATNLPPPTPPPGPTGGSPPVARAQPHPALLSVEDREAVRATLAHAMLDQERAARVPWLNERSGSGGMIMPVGAPARRGDTTCRSVLVSIQKGEDVRYVQGEACRPPMAGADWTLGMLGPFQEPS